MEGVIDLWRLKEGAFVEAVLDKKSIFEDKLNFPVSKTMSKNNWHLS